MSMSTRWLGPGPRWVVTMTKACGWAVFHALFRRDFSWREGEFDGSGRGGGGAVGNMGRRRVQAQVVISKVYILTHGSARRLRLQLHLQSQYRSVAGTKAHSHPSKHRHQRHEAPA